MTSSSPPFDVTREALAFTPVPVEGRRLVLPVYRLMGGARRKTPTSYATIFPGLPRGRPSASVPDFTGITRFSTEVRTVNIEDLRASRGAPNVDGAAPRQPLGWFHSLADGTSLAAAFEQAT